MKRFRWIGAILFLALMIQLPSSATAEEFRVMTRNLYLGAEIQSLAKAESVEEFIAGVEAALDQIEANDFPARAEALAAEIVEKRPHLVGLQEVYDFTVNGSNKPPRFSNYLTELMFQLEAQGAAYVVAATVTNLNITVPLPEGVVSVTDRDVILARADVETTAVDLSLLPFCQSSEDGCNYNVVAEAETPVGKIAFERGYVAVDTDYERFFNTHLEVRDPDPGNPLSPLVQRYQASELIAAIDAVNLISPPPGPVIVVGDINSSPEDQDTIAGYESPYMQFTEGYFDAWNLRPGKPKGFTCCYGEDLSEKASLYERIDMIFTSLEPYRVKANVVGNNKSDRTSSGLWPSDHAGVVGRLELPWLD